MTRALCLWQMNLICDSTQAKVDFFVVLTTPTLRCQSLHTVPHWIFLFAAFNVF